MHASGDFETYSFAGYLVNSEKKVLSIAGKGKKGGLSHVGIPVYAEHPSTEVLCFHYRLNNLLYRWVPGQPNPTPLFQHIQKGGLFEAWNVTFEYYIWNWVCCVKYGWPPLPLSSLRCAMAKARRNGLPPKLATCAEVLGTTPKINTQLLNKLSRPQTPTKKHPKYRYTKDDAPEDFKQLYAYCDGDVIAEDDISFRVRPLSAFELATWQLDQEINERGILVDVDLMQAALSILSQTESLFNAELKRITHGEVCSVAELDKIKKWSALKHDYKLESLTEEWVSRYLESTRIPPVVKRVLEIRQILSAANVKKLHKLKDQINQDGRLRDQYNYSGAIQTGRFNSQDVQVQNLTAKGPRTSLCNECGQKYGRDTSQPGCPRCGNCVDLDEYPVWDIKAVETAIADLKTRNVNHVINVWGRPLKVISGCIRGLFIAKRGHRFISCDFSAIEPVVQSCISECQWRIELFKGHGLLYETTASRLTGKSVDFYIQYKKKHGMHHEDRQKYGKIPSLANAYGGWIGASRSYGSDLDDDELKRIILLWRKQNAEIVDMWGGQYRWCGPGKWDYEPHLFGLEGAAIAAILTPGRHFRYKCITYVVLNNCLICQLPSGRCLYYHKPKLYQEEDKLGRGPCWRITFKGYNTNTQKTRVGWVQMDTYGGRFFENVVQAIAFDIQALAMLRLRRHGYAIVMHTHDDITVEMPYGLGSVEEMVRIMCERESWFNWWPIRADGWEHERNQKD